MGGKQKKKKVFLQGKLDLETEKIINKRVHRIVNKEEKKKKDNHSKLFKLQAA